MTEVGNGAPRVVVGVDGSSHSKLALRWAARIAAAEHAGIDAIAVWDYPAVGYVPYPEGYEPDEDMKQVLTDAVDEVFGDNRPADMRLLAVRGNPALALLDASKRALLVIVGSRGHGGFYGLLLGSVSAKVAEHASCPVLVVHEKKLIAEGDR